MFALEDVLRVAGAVFYVCSAVTGASDSEGYGANPDKPFATLDYAIGQCTAHADDLIVILPGHAESRSSTGNLALLDVAGVTVLGLGRGSKMPTFTLGHAGATISVSAANCRIAGIKVIADVADVAIGITAASGATALRVEGCWFTSGALTKELKVAISVAAGVADVVIERNRFDTDISAETGSETHAILLAGAADRIRIVDNEMIGNFGTAAIDGATAASVRVVIARNLIHNIDSTNGLGISLHASTSGIVSDNRVLGLKTNTVPVACAGCSAHENYTSAAVNESGALRPAVETFA
jgi:nitrous oxidase accessory protein NosD